MVIGRLLVRSRFEERHEGHEAYLAGEPVTCQYTNHVPPECNYTTLQLQESTRKCCYMFKLKFLSILK
jgi:hypothetical protein